MTTRSFLPLMALLMLIGACSQTPPALPSLDDPVLRLSSPFAPVTLEACLELDEDERAQRRGAADEILAEIAFHEKNRGRWIREEFQLIGRGGHITDVVIREPHRRYDHLVRKLTLATDIDPTHTGAWFRLGAYARDMGDLDLARRAFAGAATAAPHDPSTPRPEMMAMFAAVKEAWCCRELGETQEGLALIEPIRERFGLRSLELKIVYALLLADAGRFQEAYDVSMSIDAVEFPDIGVYHRGQRQTRSNYVRCWIQASAWLGIGEPTMARHALGELRFHRIAFPFKREYWNDVGLVCELAGRIDDSRLAYSLSMTSRNHLLPLLNWDIFSTPPLILDQPNVMVPCLTAYETRRIGGSAFTLGAQLLVECAQADDDSIRTARGEAAVDALTLCMRRGIRPTLALALRGRAKYYMGAFEDAEADLILARARMTDEGRADAGTELVLGTILVDGERFEEALTFLQRAVEVEPGLAGAWRTLGVTYATLGRSVEAEAALDLALDLDPESSLGWHNRGLFHASLERWHEAMTDLGVAVRLAPWNEEARHLLQRVALEMRDADLGEEALAATTRADSLAGSISRLAEGRIEARPGVITLGESGERVTALADLPDFDALADSLALAYAAHPDDDVRRELADAYLHAGRSEEAVTLFEVTSSSLSSQDRVLLLRADRDLGSVDRAAAVVARIGGPDDPDDADLWSLVALICLDHGLDAEGRLALDRALELDPNNKGLLTYRQFLAGRSTP